MMGKGQINMLQIFFSSLRSCRKEQALSNCRTPWDYIFKIKHIHSSIHSRETTAHILFHSSCKYWRFLTLYLWEKNTVLRVLLPGTVTIRKEVSQDFCRETKLLFSVFKTKCTSIKKRNVLPISANSYVWEFWRIY